MNMLFSKGFRPFFLLAALHGSVFVSLWLVAVEGGFYPGDYLMGARWHAHEMVFGFVVAVIAGFLLTAVSNWTKRETAVGLHLASLCMIWLAGRLGVLFADTLPTGLPAALDLAFIPALTATIAAPLFATKNRRNYGFLVLLAALWGVCALIHARALGWIFWRAWPAHTVAADILLLFVIVVTGRIVPAFTRNAVKQPTIKVDKRANWAALGAVTALGVADALMLDVAVTSALAGLAAVTLLLRSRAWGARFTLRNPLLLMLHVANAWLALGMLLRALAVIDPVRIALPALHALTTGGVGLIIFAMMARVPLGHTGRPLTASRATVVAFALLLLAAVSRSIVPILAPSMASPSMHTAGGLWALGLLLYLVVYTPILMRPRVDGKPG